MLGLATCSKQAGGLDAITLYEPSALTSLLYDHSAGAFEEIGLSEGVLPVTVRFAEGEALWSERLNEEGEVEHRVEFALRGALPDHLRELLSLSRHGLVALVRRRDGESFVVGYSPEAGDYYPLRPIEAQCNTRREATERGESRVVLFSCDGWFSHPYIGQ